jgi:hypothetical protein
MKGFLVILCRQPRVCTTSLNMVRFGEAKRPPRQMGPSCPRDRHQAGPGGLPVGAGVWAQFRRGSFQGFLFFFFGKRREKRNPQDGVHAWTRLTRIVGVRTPQISLTPAHLAEPGPA